MHLKVLSMKKFLLLLAAAVLAAGCLPACGSGQAPADAGDDGLRIVTTIFPEYDWVMNILGGDPAGAEVTLLLDTGVDLHSFQPSAEDILKISACDLFIYVGGESDRWVDDALQEAVNQDMIVIDLMEALGDAVREEELVEGMEADDGEDEAEYDEHVWLSLRNAAALVTVISDAVRQIDPDHADVYQNNTSAYIAELDALDAAYQAAVDGAALHTLLFGDRFPFRYLTDDYGLDYYAAFSGCSAETEASFETIAFLSQKVDELSLPAVMTIEGTDHRIAETIVQNTQSKDQQILTLDSMQSTTAEDAQNGTTYLSIMEENLSVLKEALKQEKDLWP